MNWWRYERQPSVAERRAKALIEGRRLGKAGRKLMPVVIEGRAIAGSFWGRAWCDNLESYRDYEYRLPRGRSYARNRAVLHLDVRPGRIEALVCGSDLYNVRIDIKPVARAHWERIKRRCAGRIGSLIELLQGRLSDSVMQVITHRTDGLFPRPAEIGMTCSCPDWATMCKHVAAVMYGVGARLDKQPELLFVLRNVDHSELIAQATELEVTRAATTRKTIADDALADVFGIDLETDASAAAQTRAEGKAPSLAKRRSAVRAPGRKQAGGLRGRTSGGEGDGRRKAAGAGGSRKAASGAMRKNAGVRGKARARRAK